MRLYNIDGNLIQVIEKLYNKATVAVNLNGSIGDCMVQMHIRSQTRLSPLTPLFSTSFSRELRMTH